MQIEESDRTLNRSPYYPLPRDLTFPVEKPLFQRWSSGKKTLVEIGVFEGASASTFRAAMSAEATLHLIDPFIPDSMNPNLRGRKFFAHLNVARIRNGKVKWYEDYSYNVVKTWRDPIDFLFIDGDHTEKSCQKDWDDWSPFVEVGGIVVFHDARFQKGDGSFWDGWDGPTKVVDRLFRGSNALPQWKIVEEAGTAVAVRRLS